MNDSDYQALEQRIGRVHLRQRLGIEQDKEHRVFGQGRNFFHLENWYSIHSLIRTTLMVTGMWGRGRRNARNIQVRHNRIFLPALPHEFDGFTLCHISDLHLDMSSDIVSVIADRIKQLSYDVCVITGDLRAQTFGPSAAALEGMARLTPHLKQPILGVLGNHDSIHMVPALEGMGVQLLLNESVAFTRNDARIHIAGIDDPHYYRADNLERASQNIPYEEVSILLSHSPEIYRHAAHADFDVMLCGHTHGGQICLPGGMPIWCNASCPRELCSGTWRHHDLIGYTSSGTGVSIVDVRINCPAEITLHRLCRP